MKKLELVNLTLNNFKGIEHFELKTDGKNAIVKGANGSGKTTIFDAFVWLLFGKDSQNKSDFELKGLDKNGKVKEHHLEHAVEGTFKFNDKELILKRVLMEKWTKKRGSIKEELTGHTTSYYIDHIPSKKKEFDEVIDQIVSENVFKLLTNPLFFNEQLHWKKRREILIEIAGELTTEEIIEGNQTLQDFYEKLEGRNIEDYQKLIQHQQKELQKELYQIPTRIDELLLSRKDIEADPEQLESELKQIDKKIYELQKQIHDIHLGSNTTDLQKQLEQVHFEIMKQKNEFMLNQKEHNLMIQSEIDSIQQKIYSLQVEKEKYELQIKYNHQMKSDLEKQVQEKRAEWKVTNKKTFNHDDYCICPTCKQELPDEQIDEARSNFNKEKSVKLETIQHEAVQMKEKINELASENHQLDQLISDINEKIEEENKKIHMLKVNREEMKAAEAFDHTDEYKTLQRKKEALERELNDYNASEVRSTDKQENEIRKWEQERERIIHQIDQMNNMNYIQKRINELKEIESKLNRDHEKLEEDLYLADLFNKKKIQLLETKINNQFKYARFRLFKEQVNGEIVEECETLYNGIPFSKGLNNAMRINIGIDIIQVLQDYYNVKVPIFIDNAESVIKLNEIDTQIITLVVENTDQLTVLTTKSA